MGSAFISDGYTRTDTIPRTKRHPEVTITYRPATRAERSQIILDNGKLIDKGGDSILKAHKLTAAFLAKKLVKWNATREIETRVEGETIKTDVDVEITPETIGSLEPNLLDSIFRCVCGYDDDKDVEATAFDPYAKADAADLEAQKN